MSQPLNLLVSDFTQQSSLRVNYDLYARIEKVLPVANYTELRKSVTQNAYIKPLLLAEIKRRLNGAYYTAKFLARDGLVMIYIDHEGATGAGGSFPSKVAALKTRAPSSLPPQALGAVSTATGVRGTNTPNTPNTSGTGDVRTTPTPEVLALADCIAYVCHTVLDNGDKTVKLIKFSSLSNPDLDAKLTSSVCQGNIMSYPVIIEEDVDDTEFSQLAEIYRLLLSPPNDDWNSVADVKAPRLRSSYALS